MAEGGSSHGVDVPESGGISGGISVAAMDTYVGRVGAWKGTWFGTRGHLDGRYLGHILVLAGEVADVGRATTSIPHHRAAVLALEVGCGRVGVAAVVAGDVWALEGPLRPGV